MKHKWSKKTATGNDKCANCGLIRRTYKTRTRAKQKTKYGVKLLVLTKSSYYRGNVRIDPFSNTAPPCEKKES